MNKFKPFQIVKHVGTGHLYKVRETPLEHSRLEHSGETYYKYEDIHSGNTWIRCKSEMEDGRFIELTD